MIPSKAFPVLLAVLCLIAAGGGGWGATRYVPSSVYPDIQAAVDDSSGGDVVIVSPGTYPPFSFMGKAITVRSSEPGDMGIVADTIVDGRLRLVPDVVTCEQGEGRKSVLDGLAIVYGEAGILCAGSSPTIRRCVIQSPAWYGVQISGGGRPLLEGNAISGCELGPAIQCLGNCSPLIRGNTISGNARGAIDAAGARPTVSRNLINDNGPLATAAIVIKGGSIRGNEIRSNSGQYGAIRCTGGAIIAHNLIVGNVAGVAGGGLWCRGPARIINNTFGHNRAPTGKGGNVYLYRASATIRNCIIAHGLGGGGLVSAGGGSSSVSYSNLYGNIGGDVMGLSLTGPGNLARNPRLAGRATAAGMYRLQSTAGRWDGRQWVLDAVTSPCVDAGDPAAGCQNEPVPNGGRINMGWDGNTEWASKSP